MRQAIQRRSRKIEQTKTTEIQKAPMPAPAELCTAEKNMTAATTAPRPRSAAPRPAVAPLKPPHHANTTPAIATRMITATHQSGPKSTGRACCKREPWEITPVKAPETHDLSKNP